jgi:hypothetical protein
MCPGPHCNEKSHLCIPFLGIAQHSLSPNFYIHVSVSDLYIPRIVHIFYCSRIGRPILELCTVLEITVSFLGIHK